MDTELKKSKVSMINTIKSQSKTKPSNVPQGKSLSRMKVRKGSYGFGGVSGTKTLETRISQLGMEVKRPPLIYLNTYQLEPRVKFHEASVTKAIDSVLDAYFTEHLYNAQESPQLALLIAAEIMHTVKNMGFDRHRILSIVTIGQRRAQSYNNAVAFLWDHERDSIVHQFREVPTAFVQVTIFGVYLD